MPKVSVIIPCYNLGQYLVEAVNSVLMQSYQDFEIIIVNDGSTDELTNNLLNTYHHPRCTIYTTPNQGLPATRNYGIERASGEYICCLDADDRYHPEFLEKCVQVFEQDLDGEYGLVTTWVQEFGERNGIWKTHSYDVVELLFQNVIHVASLFRRHCWDLVGGYPANLAGYQDWNFWISIIGKNYKWKTIEEPLFYYRVRPKSMVTNSDKQRTQLYKTIIDNNIDIYRKHIIPLLERFMVFTLKKDALLKQQDALLKQQDALLKQHDALLKQHDALNLKLKGSQSWKIGRIITWLPRRIIRQFKENS